MESTQYMNNKLSDELRQFRCHILDIRPIQEDEKPTFSYMTGMRREEEEEEEGNIIKAMRCKARRVCAMEELLPFVLRGEVAPCLQKEKGRRVRKTVFSLLSFTLSVFLCSEGRRI